MTVVNGKKHKAFEKIQANKASTAKADDGETAALLKRPKSNSNNDEDEDDQDEDDSGNWKRQRKNEYPVAYVFWTNIVKLAIFLVNTHEIVKLR